MARLHQRGIDLLLNVHTAIDHVDEFTAEEMRSLLKEVEIVLRDLLARDVPRDSATATEAKRAASGS